MPSSIMALYRRRGEVKCVSIFFMKGDQVLLRNYRPITNSLAPRFYDFQPEKSGFRKSYR